MTKLVGGIAALAVMAAGLFASIALAGGDGHTPTTFCHKPGTPAEQQLTSDNEGFIAGHLGHGDTLGACPGTPPDTTGEECEDGSAGSQYTEECPPPPPTETETTPTETTPTTSTPECPPPNADGTYGGQDGKPGNDRCKADPVTPTVPTSTTTTPAPPVVTPPAITPPTVTTPTVNPGVVSKPPTKTPKPDDPPVIVKVSKPNKQGVVKITTSDGKTHTGVMGQG